jgi:hypothetical protein
MVALSRDDVFGHEAPFTVEDRPDRAIFVVNRLSARGQIGDAQAPLPKPTPASAHTPSSSGPR